MALSVSGDETHHLCAEASRDGRAVGQLQWPADVRQHGDAAKVYLGERDVDDRALGEAGQQQGLWEKDRVKQGALCIFCFLLFI